MTNNPSTERYRQFRVDLVSLLRNYPDIPAEELLDHAADCLGDMVVQRADEAVDEAVETARALKGGFIPMVPNPDGASDDDDETDPRQ